MPRRREWLGAGLLVGSITAAIAGMDGVAELLHPIVGTALVLLADGLLERRRGASPLSSEPQTLVWMATLSVFLWASVEALNERRGLWAYLGWSADDLPRYAALGWTFASIVPFVALTADWLGGRSAWEVRRGGTAAAVGGLLLFGLAVRGPLPGDDLGWLAAGIAGLFLAAGGPTHSPRRLAAWSAAGCLWIALSEAVNSVAAAERYVVHPDGFAPALWPAALLLGPALGGLYQTASQWLGLPAWPPEETPSRSDTMFL
jgi:hypothetical protein